MRRIPALAPLLLVGSSLAAEPDRASARLIFREMARASGIHSANRLLHYEEAFDRVVEDAKRRTVRADSEMKRARWALDVLYAKTLRKYRERADGVDEVLDEGSYNCVSGTLLAGAVARSLGLDAHVLPLPGHLLLRLRLDGRDRVVDITRRERPLLTGPVSTRVGGIEPMSGAPGAGRIPEVELESGVAFLWNNRGKLALDRDDGLDAARSFEEAWKRHPDLAQGWEGMATLLARAFRIEYEAQRYGPAHVVASIDLAIYPGRTTATDRLEAAGLKQIEVLCDSDAPQDAEELLDKSLALIHSDSDKRRMETASCPVIARASVRVGDWPRAFRAAERFQRAERDAVEAERLLGWVESRYRAFQRELNEDFCPAVPPESEKRWLDLR